jgi:hypothetical protein
MTVRSQLQTETAGHDPHGVRAQLFPSKLYISNAAWDEVKERRN